MRVAALHATLLATAVAVGATFAGPAAHACGGCFHAPTQVTVVTGHRMVFSVSPTQTVLWDQIEYSGSPQDFAWILPVHAGATVQLSHDEFFAALDAVANPVITGPAASCGGSFGGGCGSASNGGAFASAAAGGGGQVQVLSQGVVGPYQTVTVQSTSPTALYDWLNANGYVTPDAMRPTIDAYVQGGFDFLALRLAPGQGVQAMQPVRVVSSGGGLALPLRMVAAGVGAQVGITLYVISEGRYEAQNYPNAVVDPSKLVWLHTQNESNYETLAEQLMAAGSGTWLTEYSGPAVLTQPSATVGGGSGNCGCPTSAGSGEGLSCFGSVTVPDAYYSQCQCLTSSPSCSEAGAPVLEAGADGATDAAAGPDAALGGCNADPCSTFDDLSVATVGMSGTPWITRMRAILPPATLAANDLMLQASASQTAVSNQLTAAVYDDPSYSPCSGSNNGGGGCSATADDPSVLGQWIVGGSLGLLALALVRRRQRGA
jgi:Uncharacterized protein conserved in bacteria (DUF2330)